jgi:hypothetical protein
MSASGESGVAFKKTGMTSPLTTPARISDRQSVRMCRDVLSDCMHGSHME